MGKSSAAGNRAYKETRSNGGSKEQCKQASKEADERYYQKVRENQFGRIKGRDNNVSDFNNPINDGSWHTSDDL